jgi:hypothetical protein
MTVQDLRETLTQLVALLQAADAKAATTRGLTEFVAETASFGDLTLKAFVKLAEAGRSPAAPKAKSPTKAKADPAALTAEVTDLYARAADSAVTEDLIRAACGRLATLAKDALVRVADGIELSGMKAKKKDDIVAAITNRLLDRKGAAIRRGLIDRPADAAPVGGS